MTTFTTLVDRYISLWNEPDPEARSAAIAALFAEDGTYTDPLAQVTGHAGIAAVVAGARDMFPGHAFQARGDVDGHHDIVRFGWALVPDGGTESVVEGFDVAVMTEDGRLRAVHGFLDKVPATI